MPLQVSGVVDHKVQIQEHESFGCRMEQGLGSSL